MDHESNIGLVYPHSKRHSSYDDLIRKAGYFMYPLNSILSLVLKLLMALIMVRTISYTYNIIVLYHYNILDYQQAVIIPFLKSYIAGTY